MGRARTAARKPVRAYVMSSTVSELEIHASDPESQAVLRSLGARQRWLSRSSWILRAAYDDEPRLAELFRVLRDAGFGFEDNTRDQGTPAQLFEELVAKGLLDGEFRRVGHSVDGVSRPERKGG